MGPSSDTDHTPKLYRSKETPLRLRSLLQPRDMSYSPRHRCLGRPLAYLIKSLIQNWWENRRTTTALCGDTRVSYPIAFFSLLFFFLLFCPTNAYGMSVWVTKVNLQWSLPAEGPHFPCLCLRFSFLPELYDLCCSLRRSSEPLMRGWFLCQIVNTDVLFGEVRALQRPR